MNWKVWVLSCFLSAVLPLAAEAQASRPKEGSQSNDKTQSVAVPAQVAALLRPILDEKQKSGQHDESRLSNLLYGLTQKKGRVADEALVVLMCFDVGESQEETDAVIGRGKRDAAPSEKISGQKSQDRWAHISRFHVEGEFQQSRYFRGCSQGDQPRLAQ